MAEIKKAPFKGNRGGRWNGKFAAKRKFCAFCANKVEYIDYKDIAMLTRYISDRGKIEPRRRTGTCNRHQHALALAIKQARHIALLPFVPEHIHKQGMVPPLTTGAPKAEKAPAEAAPAAEAPAVEAAAEAPVAEAPAAEEAAAE
ncbi:MAG: 30S ribosomal protein S18 [Dehalococcoidales bacterium]|jgi:small subunit ribosomal protein S18|nr:30S ribosomal protein S18 [Dehalococcoidales bacterium]